MQNRMKTHQLDATQIDDLLNRVMTGCLATLNEDGTPYVIPLHFVYLTGAIYFHGLGKGKKVDNIIASPKVSFNVYEMNGLILNDNGKPCSTNTSYESVVVDGEASIISDLVEKRVVLEAFAKKYTPQLSPDNITDVSLTNTMVLKLSIAKITGKYYK